MGSTVTVTRDEVTASRLRAASSKCTEGAQVRLILDVQSRHEVTWVYFEDIGRCGPGVADSFEWCSPLQRFEVLGKIIGTRKQERVP